MRKQTKVRRTKKHDRATFEQLESRQLYSVVTVTPGNFQAAINSSNVGDTISFTPGTYTLNAGASGTAAATFPTGRHYVGNGATIALSGGANSTSELIAFAGSSTTTEVTGFTFTDAEITCINGSFNVHGNTFTNGYRGIFLANNSNSSFNNNSFSHLAAEGMYGYPGSNNTYDNNTFDYVSEPIHLVSACNNTDVSGNVMTHVSRFGIELQEAMTNLTVTNNYMSDWVPNGSAGGIQCGISCATGYGSDITISGNVFLHNTDNGDNFTGEGCAIESMGSNVHITNNIAWGWNCFILDGAQSPAYSSNNHIYGGAFSNNDAVPYTPTQFNSSNDSLQSLGALTTMPSPSTTPASAPVVVSTPAPAPTPTTAAPTNFTANSPSDGEIDLSWTDKTSGTGTYILQRRATNGSAGFQTVATLAAGTTSYKDTNVNAEWQYTYQLTAVVSGVSSNAATLIAQVQAAPAPVVVVSAPTPAVTAAPTTFSATSPNDATVDLSWTDNTSGTGTYILQRRATNGSAGFQTIATLTAGTTSYADTNVNAQWQYTYQLTAVVSGVSSTVATLQTQVMAAPAPVVVAAPAAVVTAAPTNLTATSPNDGEVDLSWTDNSNGTATYVLQRRATHGSAGFQTIATLAAGTTSYKDTSVNAQWEYNYQLVAVANGVSSTAATVHTQVQAAPVTAAVTNFVASSPSSSEVVLTWTDNTNGQATYILQRRATHGSAGFQAIATIAPGVSSYDDVHVNAQWEYDYILTAVTNGVASAPVTVHVQVQAASGPTVSATVTTPVAPTVLLASSPNSSEVDLSWVDNTNGTASYVLARRATDGSTGYQIIAVLPKGTTSFVDTNVNAQWQYDYYLVAVVPGAASAAATVHIQVQSMLSLLAAA